jgi:uncharacterized membrane protein
MKVMRKIFTNPIAIAIASVHWLVVLFAVYSEHERSSLIGEFNQSLLVMILIFLNLLAITVTTFLDNLLTFVGIGTFNSNIGDFFAIIFVLLQWILIGYFIAFMLGEVKPTKLNLSLIDE